MFSMSDKNRNPHKHRGNLRELPIDPAEPLCGMCFYFHNQIFHNLCIGKYFWNQIRENLPSYWFSRKFCLIQKTSCTPSLVFTEHFKTTSLSKYIKILCVRLPPFVLNTFGGERAKCWWEKCSNVLREGVSGQMSVCVGAKVFTQSFN